MPSTDYHNNNPDTCQNCGNTWGQHYGVYCRPHDYTSEWQPNLQAPVKPKLTVLVHRFGMRRVKVHDAEIVEVLHGYNAFVAFVEQEDGHEYWCCCHLETGVPFSNYCDSALQAVDFAVQNLAQRTKHDVDRKLNDYPLINKQRMEHRKIKVGDWVKIINSGRNWVTDMSKMAGKIVQVTAVSDTYRGQIIYFEGGDRFSWCEWDGHFKRVHNKKETPTARPLVFSKSMLNWLHEIRRESNIARIILACFDLRENFGGWIADRVLSGEDVSYLTYRSNGNISFLPKGKECKYLDNGNWDPAGRQEGKPAKVLRKIFTTRALKMFKETDFEIFNNKFRSKFSTDGLEFKVFPASEIGNVYEMDIWTDTGALSDSCMRNKGRLMGIYTSCTKLQIVAIIHKETQKLAGRALLWDAYCPDKKETIKFLDRFYCTKEHLYEAFVEYATQNNLWYKREYKSYTDKTSLINPETGLAESVVMQVVTKLNFKCWPYIDTFSYSTEDTLTNIEDDTFYTYNCTDGCRTDSKGEHEGGDPNEGLAFDDITGEYIDEDDVVRIERGTRRGQRTHVDRTISVNGYNWWNEDEDICFSDFDGRHYEIGDCVYSDHHNTYILLEDAYEVANLGYFHKDVVTKC